MRIELLIAQTILQGFDAQYGRFLEVTAGAQQRFEQADWPAVQAAMKQRIHLYDHHVGLVVAQLKCITGPHFYDAAFLIRVKNCYSELLPDYPRAEIAESFFNSVYCRIFKHRDLTADKLYIFSEQPSHPQRNCPRPLARQYPVQGDLMTTLEKVLGDLPMRLPWENAPRDVDYIATALQQRFSAAQLSDAVIEMATEIFYRNKAAWIIGKIRIGQQVFPLLLPLHLGQKSALFVDACLTDSNDASIVFGFARSYFMVYAPQPGALVEWLREILPAKTTAELYSAIGCQKHAKRSVIVSIYVLWRRPMNLSLWHRA